MGPREAVGVSRTQFAIEDFLARSGAGTSTLKTYGYQLRQLEGWLGRPLARATDRDLGTLKKKLRTLASGPQYAALLRMFYRSARRPDLLELCVLRQRTKRLRPEDVLTLPEVQRLLDVATNSRDKAVVGALWETGVRIHELLALDLEDVRETKTTADGGRDVYILWFKKTKVAGEEHSGYVLETAPLLRTWLKAHIAPRPDAPLFPTWDGGRLHPTTVRKLVQVLARRAGLGKRIYPHLFRHSRATHLLRLGIPEGQVKKLLGWKPGSLMIARYSHLVDRDAYIAYLRAHGIPVPESADVGRLAFDEDQLRPVLPRIAQAPAPRMSAAELRELEVLLLDPKVAAVIALLQKAKNELKL